MAIFFCSSLKQLCLTNMNDPSRRFIVLKIKHENDELVYAVICPQKIRKENKASDSMNY